MVTEVRFTAWSGVRTNLAVNLEELARRARSTNGWKVEANYVSQPALFATGCVAVSAPDGRIAVASVHLAEWECRSKSLQQIARTVLRVDVRFGQRWKSEDVVVEDIMIGLFNPNAKRLKDRYEIAMAAARVFHAKVFGYEPVRRDVLYVKTRSFDAKRVLAASDDMLEACVALMEIDDESRALDLITNKYIETGVPRLDPTP